MSHEDEYAKGFAEGETQRFYDKQRGTIRVMPEPFQIKTQRAWGFWDGYRPRSAAWYVGASPVLFDELNYAMEGVS